MNIDPVHLACLKIWSSLIGFLAADGFVWVTDGYTVCRLRAKTDTGNLYSADGVEWTTEGSFPPIAQVWKSPRGRPHRGAVGVNMAFMLRVEATRKLLVARQVAEARQIFACSTARDRQKGVSAAKHVDVGFRFAGELDPIAVTVGPDLEILIMPMRLGVGA